MAPGLCSHVSAAWRGLGPWAEGSATAVTYSEDTGAILISGVRWADLRFSDPGNGWTSGGRACASRGHRGQLARFTGAPSSTVTVSCEFASA